MRKVNQIFMSLGKHYYNATYLVALKADYNSIIFQILKLCLHDLTGCTTGWTTGCVV